VVSAGVHDNISQLISHFFSGQQYTLLDWLEKVTYPMEAKFADVDFARRTYSSVVRRIVDAGVSEGKLIITVCLFIKLQFRQRPAVTTPAFTLKRQRFWQMSYTHMVGH